MDKHLRKCTERKKDLQSFSKFWILILCWRLYFSIMIDIYWHIIHFSTNNFPGVHVPGKEWILQKPFKQASDSACDLVLSLLRHLAAGDKLLPFATCFWLEIWSIPFAALRFFSPRKLVSGKSLHDAVAALGLTRYNVQARSMLSERLYPKTYCFDNFDVLLSQINGTCTGSFLYSWSLRISCLSVKPTLKSAGYERPREHGGRLYRVGFRPRRPSESTWCFWDLWATWPKTTVPLQHWAIWPVWWRLASRRGDICKSWIGMFYHVFKLPWTWKFGVFTILYLFTIVYLYQSRCVKVDVSNHWGVMLTLALLCGVGLHRRDPCGSPCRTWPSQTLWPGRMRRTRWERGHCDLCFSRRCFKHLGVSW